MSIYEDRKQDAREATLVDFLDTWSGTAWKDNLDQAGWRCAELVFWTSVMHSRFFSINSICHGHYWSRLSSSFSCGYMKSWSREWRFWVTWRVTRPSTGSNTLCKQQQEDNFTLSCSHAYIYDKKWQGTCQSCLTRPLKHLMPNWWNDCVLECVHCTTQPEFRVQSCFRLWLQLMHCAYLLCCVWVFQMGFGVWKLIKDKS